MKAYLYYLHEFSALGPVGNMKIASAEKGAQLVDLFVKELATVIEEFRATDISGLIE